MKEVGGGLARRSPPKNIGEGNTQRPGNVKLSWGDPNQILQNLGIDLGLMLRFSHYSEASSESGVVF